jgi:putative FmdB family regulatory protein
MPAYVYTCQSCQSQQEIRHGINDPPPTGCPACGGTLERVFTAPRISAGNYSSPTAARYRKMTPSEEVGYARTQMEERRRPSPPP